jgi:hypothetical protein
MKQAKFPPFGSGAVGEKRQHQKIGRRKKRPRKEARLCARWRFIPFAKWRGRTNGYTRKQLTPVVVTFTNNFSVYLWFAR